MRAAIITDPVRWNAFIEQAATGNITQTFQWGALSYHGGAALRVGALDNSGALQGAMQALVTQTPGLRRPYLYVPRGPVVDDPNSPALPALLALAHTEARRRGAFMLRIEPSVPDGDITWLTALHRLGFRGSPYHQHIRHEWLLDITPDEQTLLAGMREKWRYNIRLAARKGVTVRPATGPEDVHRWYAIYQETGQRDGFFIHPEEHYQQVFRLYQSDERCVLLLAEYQSELIAGIFLLRCGRCTTYMFGASANAHRNLMPNHLLQWTGIRWAREHGCTLYDFRGIPEVLEPGQDQYGVYQFKRGFGGYPQLFLATHDYVYNPALYRAFMLGVGVKRRVEAWRRWRERGAGTDGRRGREEQVLARS
jgi:peptidoglycan pentaglycine glycine transferase (the first glycine)